MISIRPFAPLVVLALASVACNGTSSGKAVDPLVRKGDTVVLNGRAIDMAGDAVIEKGFVVVRGEKIVATRRGSIDPSSDVKVIDAHGGTIMPGSSTPTCTCRRC